MNTYSKKMFKVAFIAYSAIMLISYVAIIYNADAVRLPPSKAITYFSIWSVHFAYISLGLKAFQKNNNKFINAFVGYAIGCMTMTMFIYFIMQWDISYSSADSALIVPILIQDILVHALLPIVLMVLVTRQIIYDKYSYGVETILLILPILFTYHLFVTWWSGKLGGYYPYKYFDPTLIGTKELWIRYIIVVITTHIMALMLIIMSKRREMR